nr:hypothetical protein [Tanacetum cinerariifolium]
MGTMASTTICLANNQNFNLSKYIFDNMVKNLEDVVKFFMFPRFVQLFVNHQLEEVGEGSEVPTDIHHTPIVTKPLSSQPQKKQKSRRKQRKETKVPHTEPQTKESVPTTSNDRLPSGEDRMRLTELMNLFTNLQKQVLDLEKPKTAQAKEINDLKKRVKKLDRKKKSRTSSLKRLWKERMIDNIDQDVEITLVDETQGRINEEEMFGVDDLEGDEVIMGATAGEEVEQSTKLLKRRLVLLIQLQLLIVEERLKKTQAEVTEGSSKRARDELEQENAKRQMLEKEDDSAELKRYLEIVPEDDDDVTIKATPLSSKSLTIVDYKIYKEGRKSYFKIIRADGNSHNYLSFGKMFKNFNREDLEVL